MPILPNDIPFHDAPSKAPITRLYAFLAVDEKGNEGICAAPIPVFGTQALITASEHNRKYFRKIAAEMGTRWNKTIIEAEFIRSDAPAAPTPKTPPGDRDPSAGS